ncbi:MAG: DUF2214 domain-containing protein [Proteobacteria bacterium]|nr:DUF2214 domain-containing protein [Pseudomonadota bacterium]
MLNEFFEWLQNTDLAFEIGATWWFPFLESIHVVGVVCLVGSILMVDLRVLKLAALRYPLTPFMRELTPWSWLGFGLAVVTGAGMFITRPTHYAQNPAFLTKLVLLLLAGVNLLWFHKSSRAAQENKLAAACSLLLWAAAVIAGRWTGHLN